MNKLLLAFIIIIPVFISCSNDARSEHRLTDSNTENIKQNKGNDGQQQIKVKSNERKLSSKWYSSGDAFSLEPLTITQFQDIIDNDLNFKELIIDFSVSKDPSRHYVFGFQIGSGYSTITLNGQTTDASLSQLKNPPSTQVCDYSVDLPVEQLDGLFAFLQSESAYFFNHEEFEGLDLPVVTQNFHMHFNNINFSLSVVNRISSDPVKGILVENGYGISKSVEELQQGTPLYNLIQLIETEYFPILMAHPDGDCY